jgi:hypothetical protein
MSASTTGGEKTLEPWKTAKKMEDGCSAQRCVGLNEKKTKKKKKKNQQPGRSEIVL